jgi:hypothetical protein
MLRARLPALTDAPIIRQERHHSPTRRAGPPGNRRLLAASEESADTATFRIRGHIR